MPPQSLGPPLRILALAKQIPVFETMRLGPDGCLVRGEGIQHINDYCRRAISKGKELAELTGGTLEVMTMGPPEADTVCREALAFGASGGIHITDEAFAGSDTLATAQALAAAIELLGPYDLILCGLNSLDADTGQVPPQLAQLLGLPFAAGVKQLDPSGLAAETASGRKLHLELEHDDEYCQVELPLPALLSCAERLCDPCKIKDPEIWAQMDGNLIRQLSAADLGPGPWGQEGSPTYVGDCKTIEVDREQTKLSPDATDEAALNEAVSHTAQRCLERGALTPNSAASDNSPAVPQPQPDLPADAPGIAVLVEPNRLRLTRELLGAAAELAQQTQGSVTALGCELPSAAELGSFGATQGVELVSPLAYVPEEDLATAAAAWLQTQPQIWAVLAPGTAWGRQVAARLAALCSAGLVGDAIGLEAWPGNTPAAAPKLIADKPALGGYLVAEIGCTSPLQLATVRSGVLPLLEPCQDAPPATMSQHDCPPVSQVTILAKTRDDDSSELANAEVVLGVGQGVDPAHYPQLEELQRQLGASLCATRKVTDQGWLPRARQVGITGHTISPRLFISLGSSGKFNHTVGVRTAGTVVAINTDPDAPVFEVSDIGLVGDWQVVLPPLVEALVAATPAPG